MLARDRTKPLLDDSGDRRRGDRIAAVGARLPARSSGRGRPIRDILDVASRAPSGTNMQPWRVYVDTGADEAAPSRRHPQLRHPRRKGAWDEYKYYPDKFFEPYLRRRRAVGFALYGHARHRQARRRPDARAARPQLRVLRRARRHDLHHRPPAEPGLVDRLRHVPAEHHDRGAGEGTAHLPAGRLRALSRADQAGPRHSRRGDRRSAAWRSATRTRRSPRTGCAPTAHRWTSG